MTHIDAAYFEKAIADAIRNYVEDAVKEAVEEVKARIDREVPKIMAEVGVAVQKALNAKDIESVIQIRLRPKL